jgi:hypothetical protein
VEKWVRRELTDTVVVTAGDIRAEADSSGRLPRIMAEVDWHKAKVEMAAFKEAADAHLRKL